MTTDCILPTAVVCPKTGIEKICQACDADGSPKPEYTINPGDIMIKFTASEDRVIRIGSQGATAKVTDKEPEVLNLIREDPGVGFNDYKNTRQILKE